MPRLNRCSQTYEEGPGHEGLAEMNTGHVRPPLAFKVTFRLRDLRFLTIVLR